MGPVAKRLIDETLRFLAVGGVATLVAFVLFNLLLHGFAIFDDPWLHGRPTLAYVIANTVGMVISYRGTKTWAFKNRQTAHPDGGLSAYVGINLATMILPVACLWFSRNILDQDSAFADNIAANVVGLGLGTLARFYLFRQVIFSQKNYQPAALVGTTSGPLPDNALLVRRHGVVQPGPVQVSPHSDRLPESDGSPRSDQSPRSDRSPQPDPRSP